MEPGSAVVMTTVAGGEDAASLSRGLVGQRLAACVQEVAIRSTYRWEEAVQVEAEVLLLIKTAEDKVEEVVDYLGEHHPYQVPEILALGAEAAEPYREWLLGATRQT